MKKNLAALLLIVFVSLTAFTATLYAADSSETLSIRGDGVEREITLDRAELQAMGSTKNIYSASNNFPTDKVFYRQGVALESLLRQAGIKDDAQLLKFISSDGYSRIFTKQELLGDERYCFSADGSKTKVATIIAFKDSGKDFNSMSDIEAVLTMGQRVKGEQNNPWFVKYLESIEVSTAMPEQWAAVTFKKTAAGSNETEIELEHSNFDMVKIYYTTDGSDPDINSKVYNISASYYQPHLNQAIKAKGNTEIRAIAIGAGKTDSAVSSSLNTAGEIFADLGDYPWASAAINDLSKQGIIKGMGESRFAPGENLTRAQFATMVILALGESAKTDGKASFSDVKSGDWHYGFVEKAAELGLIKGYPDATFRPEQLLSRQEMLAIAVQTLAIMPGKEEPKLDLKAIGYPFAEESRISDWARDYAVQAEAEGILEHGHIVVQKANGLYFDAPGPSTRAEAAMTIYLMLKK